MPNTIDLERLLKLRVIVARYGEMDGARWWNTRGQLGTLGASVLRRGFPRTHWFAQARSVFAVAGERCREVFDPPRSVTLWRLTEDIEEEFDTKWEHWLDHAAEWAPFFEKAAALGDAGLDSVLQSFDLVSSQDLDAFARSRRSPDAPALQLPAAFAGTNDDVGFLALGFARGEPGALVVPYARTAEA